MDSLVGPHPGADDLDVHTVMDAVLKPMKVVCGRMGCTMRMTGLDSAPGGAWTLKVMLCARRAPKIPLFETIKQADELAWMRMREVSGKGTPRMCGIVVMVSERDVRRSLGRKRRRGRVDPGDEPPKKRRRVSVAMGGHEALQDPTALRKAIHARLFLAMINLFRFPSMEVKGLFRVKMRSGSRVLNAYVTRLSSILPALPPREDPPFILRSEVGLLEAVVEHLRSDEALAAWYARAKAEDETARPTLRESFGVLKPMWDALIEQAVESLRSIHQVHARLLEREEVAIMG